jgi:hypothetical protein
LGNLLLLLLLMMMMMMSQLDLQVQLTCQASLAYMRSLQAGAGCIYIFSSSLARCCCFEQLTQHEVLRSLLVANSESAAISCQSDTL